jgi:hypothetical protein
MAKDFCKAFLQLQPGATARVVFFFSTGQLFFIQYVFDLEVKELLAIKSYFYLYVKFAMHRFGLIGLY